MPSSACLQDTPPAHLPVGPSGRQSTGRQWRTATWTRPSLRAAAGTRRCMCSSRDQPVHASVTWSAGRVQSEGRWWGSWAQWALDLCQDRISNCTCLLEAGVMGRLPCGVRVPPAAAVDVTASWQLQRGRVFQGARVPGCACSRGRVFQGTRVPGCAESSMCALPAGPACGAQSSGRAVGLRVQVPGVRHPRMSTGVP